MKKTTIIAGSIEVTGQLKGYEFTKDQVIFNFVINPLDTVATGELFLPRPKDAMVEAIQRLGISNLSGAVVNFNKGAVDVNRDTPGKKNAYVPRASGGSGQIGSGSFF